MDYILHFAIPRRKVANFAPYFASYAALHQEQDHKDPAAYRKALWPVMALQLNLLGWVIHYVLLSLFPHSYYIAVMHGDSIQVFNIQPEWLRFTYPPLLLMVFYFTHQIYFSIPPRLVQRIRVILMDKDNGFFIAPYQYRNGEPAGAYVQRYSINLINRLQFFTVFVAIGVLTVQVIVSYYLIVKGPQYFSDSSISIWLGIPVVLFLWQLRFISGLYFLYQLIFALSMLIVLSTVLLTSVLVRFWQARLIVRRLLTTERAFIVNLLLDRFLVANRETMIRLVEANRFVGKLWYFFLLLSYPISCFVIVQVLFIPMDPFLIYSDLVFFFNQILLILVLHIGIVVVNRRITLPNHGLMHIAVHRRNGIYLHNKLRLSLYLQAFHTKRNYGITYYKFGLVSLWSFTKCIFLYFELLLYAYMMVIIKK